MLTVGTLRTSRLTWGILLGFFVLATILSWLQAWSGSSANAFEVLARPAFVAVFGLLLLRGFRWARWVLAVSAVAYAVWFARAAVTPNAMTDWHAALWIAAALEVGLVVALFMVTSRRPAEPRLTASPSDGA